MVIKSARENKRKHKRDMIFYVETQIEKKSLVGEGESTIIYKLQELQGSKARCWAFLRLKKENPFSLEEKVYLSFF